MTKKKTTNIHTTAHFFRYIQYTGLAVIYNYLQWNKTFTNNSSAKNYSISNFYLMTHQQTIDFIISNTVAKIYQNSLVRKKPMPIIYTHYFYTCIQHIIMIILTFVLSSWT